MQAASNGSVFINCTASMRQRVGTPGVLDVRLGEHLDFDTLHAPFAPLLFALAWRPL
jgi:hypothetical protein